MFVDGLSEAGAVHKQDPQNETAGQSAAPMAMLLVDSSIEPMPIAPKQRAKIQLFGHLRKNTQE